MGTQYYPTVKIYESPTSWGAVEEIFTSLRDRDDVEMWNWERKYTEKEMNGDVEVDGYIKFSFTVMGVDVYARYSDGEMAIHYQSDRIEDIADFQDAITAFEDVIVPEVEKVYGSEFTRAKVQVRPV
jgi:hypothetical protein